MKKQTLFLAAALCAMFLAALPVAADPALDAAFNALKTYQFGQDREPLSVVNDAVQSSYGNKELRAVVEQKLAETLAQGCTDDAARFICRELAEIATDVSVPALAGLLKNETLAEAAIDALERTPGDMASAVLRDALGTLADRYKIGVINALAARRDLAAVPALAGLAAGDNADLAVAALRALGMIGGKEAQAAVATALASPASPVRNAAVDAAILQAEGLLKAGDAKAAQALFQTMTGAGEAMHVRTAALRGVAACDPANAPELLREAFKSGDAGLQAAATALLREAENPATLAEFAKQLDTFDVAAQLLLLPAMSDRGVAIEAPQFKKLFAADEAVALAAIQAAPACGDAACAELLVDLAANAKGDIRRAARENLVAMRNAGVNSALLNLAKQGNGESAAEAVRALGDRVAKEAAADLTQLAAASDEPVGSEAWKALKNVAPAEALPELVGMLVAMKNRDAAEQAAVRTIAAAAERIDDPERRADAVLAELAKEPKDIAVRTALLKVLGQIPSAASLSAILPELEDSNDVIRQAAIAALAGWPTVAPAEALEAVVRAPRNDNERSAAFAGFVDVLKTGRGGTPQVFVNGYKKAVALAANENEKKRVLSALGGLQAAEAFELIDAAAQGANLPSETALATLNAAKTLWGAYPEEAKTRLAALAGADNEDLRKQAAAILDLMSKTGDFITAWEYSGPYMAPGKPDTALLDTAFPPEDPAAKDVAWQVFPAAANPDQPTTLDLGRVIGGEQRVAYLRTFVNAPAACDAVLLVGSNDGVKVLVNGAVVHKNNIGRPLNADNDQVAIKLNAGWNTIILAVSQMGGDWGACARVHNANGEAVPGLRFSVKPE